MLGKMSKKHTQTTIYELNTQTHIFLWARSVLISTSFNGFWLLHCAIMHRPPHPITWWHLSKFIMRALFLQLSPPPSVGLDRSGTVQWMKVWENPSPVDIINISSTWPVWDKHEPGLPLINQGERKKSFWWHSSLAPSANPSCRIGSDNSHGV